MTGQLQTVGVAAQVARKLTLHFGASFGLTTLELTGVRPGTSVFPALCPTYDVAA
jgi:hypothetical protein